MNNFGLGNRKITDIDKFEITTPSGRKTPFTRAKTDYVRHALRVQNTDFANSPVAIENQITMLRQLRVLAQQEQYDNEFVWIDEQIEELRKKITESTVESFAQAYYQPFYINSTPEEQKAEMLNPESDLMQLLNSCKISDTEFDPNAEVILNAYKDKTNDIYHLSYLIDKCRNNEDGLINPQLAQGVSIIAAAGVDCSNAAQFLDINTSYEPQTGAPIVDFDKLQEISEFKDKKMDDVSILKYQRFLGSDFEDREKIKGFIFKFNDTGMNEEDTLSILDALKVNVSDDKFDIKSEAVDSILNLKKILGATRKNEVEERKLSPESCWEDFCRIDENTVLVKTAKGFSFENISDDAPEEIRKKYDEAINATENGLLTTFAKKYVGRDGLIDSKYLRVASFLRNAGVVYKSMIPLIDASINREGTIKQSDLEAVKQLKAANVLSADILPFIKKCPKNDDGTVHLESLKNYFELQEANYSSEEAVGLLNTIKVQPEQKEFLVDVGQFFDDKQNVFKLLPLIKNKEGNVDENSADVIYSLGCNIVKNHSQLSEKEMVDEILIIMDKVKDSTTGEVSDEAAGTCSILSRNAFSTNAIWNVLVACENSSGGYDEGLSEIVWKMAVEKATPVEIVNVLKVCRSVEDHSILADKTAYILDLFNQGAKKDDVIAQLNKE